MAQHVTGDTPPITRSSKTVIAASSFTYVFGCRPLRWLSNRSGLRWWWAVCRPKHVEQLRNIGIINFTTRSHLVGSFYKIDSVRFCVATGEVFTKFSSFQPTWWDFTYPLWLHNISMTAIDILSNKCTSWYDTHDIHKLLHFSTRMCHHQGISTIKLFKPTYQNIRSLCTVGRVCCITKCICWIMYWLIAHAWYE